MSELTGVELALIAVNLEKQKKEIARLREALKFYADEDNYNLTAEAEKVSLCEYIHMVDMDNGDKARKALEGSK